MACVLDRCSCRDHVCVVADWTPSTTWQQRHIARPRQVVGVAVLASQRALRCRERVKANGTAQQVGDARQRRRNGRGQNASSRRVHELTAVVGRQQDRSLSSIRGRRAAAQASAPRVPSAASTLPGARQTLLRLVVTELLHKQSCAGQGRVRPGPSPPAAVGSTRKTHVVIGGPADRGDMPAPSVPEKRPSSPHPGPARTEKKPRVRGAF